MHRGGVDMKKTEKLMLERILNAIEEITDDICQDRDAEKNKTRAEAIEALARAVGNIKI